MAANKFVVKNGIQSQNIDFVSPDNINTIQASMLNSDTLSFSGNSGQLFSISDNLSGTIFAVNDISGLPSIEVDADGTVRIAELSGNVGIGVANPTEKLEVAGSVKATSFIGTVVGNTTTSSTWTTARTITLNGDVSGSVSIDGSSNVTMTTVVDNDSHNHS